MDTFAEGVEQARGMFERVYNVRVFVAGPGKATFGDNLMKVNDLINKFHRLYLTLCQNGLHGDGTHGEYPILLMNERDRGRDTGQGVLDYNGQQFHGFEFNIKILDKVREGL